MITYSKAYGGFSLIFRLYGTAWPYGVVPGLIAVGASLLLGAFEDVDEVVRTREIFISHPYSFQLFAYLLGILMVFRTNFAYNRYWEAIGMVQAMAAKWLDGVCMGVAFDADGAPDSRLLYGSQETASQQPHRTLGHKGGMTHAEYVADLMHICSLLHALALQHLRQDEDLDNLKHVHLGSYDDVKLVNSCKKVDVVAVDTPASHVSNQSLSSSLRHRVGLVDWSTERIAETYSQQQLPVLGGVSEQERAVLTSCNGTRMTTEARVAMVECWFMRRLIARQKHEQGDSHNTSPPILSRLYQVISDGSLWFSHASKISLTPFPFPYHNLISILLWIFTLLVPLVVNGTIMETTTRCVFSFMPAFAYHALAACGDNLEDPFLPYDVNELPLPELQQSVNLRLQSFACVPQRQSSPNKL